MLDRLQPVQHRDWWHAGQAPVADISEGHQPAAVPALSAVRTHTIACDKTKSQEFAGGAAIGQVQRRRWWAPRSAGKLSR